MGRLAPTFRAGQSTRSAKSAVTMQFKVPEFKIPQFNAPQFPTGGGASVKTVAVSGEMPQKAADRDRARGMEMESTAESDRETASE